MARKFRPPSLRTGGALAAAVGAGAVLLRFFTRPRQWPDLEQLPTKSATEVVAVCESVGRHLGPVFWADSQEKDSVINSGGLIAMSKAMERYRADPKVQMKCVNAISACVAGVERHQRQAAGTGALEAVLGALREHKTNGDVLSAAAQALGCLADFYHANSGTFGKMGASEIFMEALHAQRNDPKVLFGLYCGLTGMTCHNIPENNRRLVELGLIDVGLEHMRAFPKEHSIREEVQPVLSCLVRSPKNETMKQMIVDAGYIEEVLSAMHDFPADQRLVSKSLESIRDFSAYRPDIAKRWLKGGAVELMAQVMANFEPMTRGAVFWDVHTSGAQAAWVLSMQVEESWLVMRRAGLHKQLVRSLGGHPDARQAACGTLGTLAKESPEARAQLLADGVPEHCLSAAQ